MISTSSTEKLLNQRCQRNNRETLHGFTKTIATVLSITNLICNGGFRITKRTSNSNDILNSLLPSEISPKATSLD